MIVIGLILLVLAALAAVAAVHTGQNVRVHLDGYGVHTTTSVLWVFCAGAVAMLLLVLALAAFARAARRRRIRRRELKAQRADEAAAEENRAAGGARTDHHVEDIRRAGRPVDWPAWCDPAVRRAFEQRGIERPWAHQAEAAGAAWSGQHVVSRPARRPGSRSATPAGAVPRRRSGRTAAHRSLPVADEGAGCGPAGAGRGPGPVGGARAAARDVRRGHPARGAALGPRARDVRADQPRPAAPLAAARPCPLGVVPAGAVLRGRRRVPPVPRGVRLARRDGAAPPAPGGRAVRRAADLRPGVGHGRRAGGARPAADRARRAGRDRRRLAAGTVGAGAVGAAAGPGQGGARRPARRSASTETGELLADLVASGVRTLAFGRSRRGVESMAAGARRGLAEVDPDLVGRVAAYRGGYLPEDRRALEQALRVRRPAGAGRPRTPSSSASTCPGSTRCCWPGGRARGPRSGSRSGGPGGPGRSPRRCSSGPTTRWTPTSCTTRRRCSAGRSRPACSTRTTPTCSRRTWPPPRPSCRCDRRRWTAAGSARRPVRCWTCWSGGGRCGGARPGGTGPGRSGRATWPTCAAPAARRTAWSRTSPAG